MGRDSERGHPVTTHEDVPSHGVSYRRLELIPPPKLGPHPQSCAVSTHRPMESAGCLQARRSFRLRLSRPCHSDQTPRGTRPSCTCIRGAARARCARESGRLRESFPERRRESSPSNAKKILSRRRSKRFS